MSPSSAQAGRDAGAPAASARRGHSTTGRASDVSAARAAVHDGQPLGGGDVGDHDRERLVVAGLAPAQLGDRVAVGRVDDQVVAADPLDRHDRPGAQRVGDRGERVVAVRPARRPTVRATSRAGRTQDRRWAGRGSDGRRDRRTRAGTPRTSRTRPSWWRAGRRARPSRSCSGARSSVQFVNG